jgi:hypothetical protein
VLAQLDKLPGVERSYSNHTGSLVRLSVAPAADPEKVAEQALKVLDDQKRSPVRLAGAEFTRALDEERWRESERVGELSAIEFRTLALRQVKAFADEEKLGKDSADKLARIAEEEWGRLARGGAPGDPKQPGKVDWRGRCRQFVAAVADRAKQVLTAEQVERLRGSFTLLSGGEPRK